MNPAPPSEPDRRISRIKCGAPHLMRYVAKEKMWRSGQERPCLLGIPRFLRHISFGDYNVLRKPLKPFRPEGPWRFSSSGASHRANASAFIFRSLSA